MTNRTLLNGLKKRLSEAKANWINELQSVLWAYRITPRAATGESPYMLAFGSEAVIPAELGLPTHRVLNFNSPVSDLMRRLDLDMLEEVREEAAIRNAAYQQRTTLFYNKRVKKCDLKEGDYVLNKVIQKHNKLEANWHGPYRVTEVVRPGTYRIATLEGEEFKNAWNAEHLRKYYQ